MNCFSKSLLLSATLLLLTTYPLPAPIFEASSPTPAPQQSAKPKVKPSKPKGNDEWNSIKAKSESQSSVSFAGTWTGTANGRIQQAVFGPKAFSSNYNLQISPGEQTATWTSSAWIFAKFHAPVQRKGRTLNWTCERHDLAGKTAVFCRLEMNANGTAQYSESSGLVNGVFKGAGYQLSGTLVRQ
jgi:hypothetical protein